MGFRKAAVHSKDFLSKEGGFVAPGSGPNLQQHVLFVVRVLGQQKDLQLAFAFLQGAPDLGSLLLGQFPELGLGMGLPSHLPGIVQIHLELLVLPELLHHRSQIPVSLGMLLIDGRIGQNLRISQKASDLLVGRFQLREFV